MFFEEIYESWKPKQFKKYEELSRHVDLKKLFHKKRVLDIASGPCWFEEFLSSRSVDASGFIAVDKSMKHLLERTAQVPAICSDIKKLEKPGVSLFDAIVAIDCLHLIDFDFKKYMKKNGIVVASLFFSSDMEGKKALLKQKLKGLKIVKEIIIKEGPAYKAGENEIFVLAETSRNK